MSEHGNVDPSGSEKFKETDAENEQPLDVFQRGLSMLWMFPDFSDFTVHCGDRTWKVHKAVICSQSAFFRAACKSFVESKVDRITLHSVHSDDHGDDHADMACDFPRIVGCMLNFFYYLDYEIPSSYNTTGAERNDQLGVWSNVVAGEYQEPPTRYEVVSKYALIVHAHVFAAAVMYQAPGLQTLSVTKFKAAVQYWWRFDSFADAIRVVYTTTADHVMDLREIVENALISHDELLERSKFQAVMIDCPILSLAIARKVLRASKANAATADTTKHQCAVNSVTSNADPCKLATYADRTRGIFD